MCSMAKLSKKKKKLRQWRGEVNGGNKKQERKKLKKNKSERPDCANHDL